MATSDNDRDALIEATMPYVRHLAVQLARDLPTSVALDDLVAAGHAGLVTAAGRYDPSRGAQFTTYAHYRIRGSMLDHVRDLAADHPVYRARAAAEAAVDDLVERRLGESPPATSQAEAAQALAGLLGEMAAAVTLAEIAAETAPEREPDPEAALAVVERARQIDAAMEAIPERERTILRAVYFDGQSIEQAGRAMGLSKSWSSRLHAKAVASMRARLEAIADVL